MADASHISRTKIAVFISGNGSNLQALIEASSKADYPAEIALVISNKAEVYGLIRAEKAGINHMVIDHNAYATRADFENALQQALEKHGIAFICLAGFMRVLGARFTQKWARRMINIHPALLPKFKGLNTHTRAISAGELTHGCSVHWVSAGVDEGEIIVQKSLKIQPEDTAETLQKRVQILEHQLYPDALRQALVGDGR
jgi:phosphoribosylglycinamide formyltransferase-1